MAQEWATDVGTHPIITHCTVTSAVLTANSLVGGNHPIFYYSQNRRPLTDRQ